jgi:acyl-CoA reductase-like NAD-dependent aldehyde dehydrogenase
MGQTPQEQSAQGAGGHSRVLSPFTNYIGGAEIPAQSGQTFTSINPTTGAAWGEFASSAAADVDHAVQTAHQAFAEGPWGKLSPTRKGRLMMQWGEKIAEHAEEIGRLETQQNGKLLAEMRSQAVAARDWLYYFGGVADKIEGNVIPLDRTSVFNYSLLEPVGVVGVIVPWNSPTFITMMAICPALAAGNTVVIKPSEVTSASALLLVRLAEDAGFPPGVINIVTGGRETGEALVDHELVRRINFTGSEAGGRAIGARAGKRLVGAVLELGGKSANIIFEDADLERAEAGILSGIFAAAGQTCVAGSRALIHASIYDRLVERLVGRAGNILVGDPLLAGTQMGPVATKAQLDRDEMMVGRAVEDGGKILTGGRRLALNEFPDGYFYQPTILESCGPNNFITQNEVFGPVLTVTPFKDADEVVRLANGTAYGLAAGLWTKDLTRAHAVARRLEAGTVWINTYRAMAFNSPFGGYKASGIGRQNGHEAVKQYLQTKSIWCELSDQIQDPFVLKT